MRNQLWEKPNPNWTPKQIGGLSYDQHLQKFGKGVVLVMAQNHHTNPAMIYAAVLKGLTDGSKKNYHPPTYQPPEMTSALLANRERSKSVPKRKWYPGPPLWIFPYFREFLIDRVHALYTDSKDKASSKKSGKGGEDDSGMKEMMKSCLEGQATQRNMDYAMRFYKLRYP